MSAVVVGMGPRQRCAAIEVMDGDETVLGRGRDGRCPSGYRAMVRSVRHWPQRVWAIEGCRGTGGPVARRLLADGDQVVDVPPRLPARTGVFTAGQGRKTDAGDAHAVALAAVRGRGRHRAARATLRSLGGIGPSGAARLLAGAGDLTRFPGRGHFASWNGTAQAGASCGGHGRHRLSRAANRQNGRVPHIMAFVQPRHPAKGRACYDRKAAAGNTPVEAMRARKRKLCDVVFRQMIADARSLRTGPARHTGTAPDSSAAGSHPDAGPSDQPLPGPATSDPLPIPPAHPAATTPRRTAAAVKRAGLDRSQDRHTLASRE